jgi:phosphoribosylglycinamide formyltransferase-1
MHKRVVLFAYNLPHKKTPECLFSMFASNLKPDFIIAQDSKTLPYNADSIGVVPKESNYLMHPKQIAKAFNILYLNADHDGPEAHNALRIGGFDLGVITGARILHKNTIDLLPDGIINMHPGALPENRGLDNLKRAILKDYPPMVTVHKINSQIDPG